MNDLMRTTLIGLSVGVIGTGMGGLISFVLNKPSKKFLSGIIGLSSGLMLAVVSFELLPEAYRIGGVEGVTIGLGVGAIMASFLDSFISNLKYVRGRSGQNYIKTGILLGIGIALHNFPEGLAIGSGIAAEAKMGFGLAIVIALHNMPEGIAMVTPMRVGGYSKWKAFLSTLLAGAPMGLGAYLGAIVGKISYSLIGLCLAFAGGTMLYITVGELIPKGKELDNGKISTIFAIFGFMLGVLISKTF